MSSENNTFDESRHGAGVHGHYPISRQYQNARHVPRKGRGWKLDQENRHTQTHRHPHTHQYPRSALKTAANSGVPLVPTSLVHLCKRTLHSFSEKLHSGQGTSRDVISVASRVPGERAPTVIAIYCHEYTNAWFPNWGPSSLGKGLGGSEEVVIYVSRELARLG